MSAMPTTWDEYRDQLRAYYGLAITDDWLAISVENERRQWIASGQLRIGRPGDWYATLRWSNDAWLALHGEKGPRR